MEGVTRTDKTGNGYQHTGLFSPATRNSSSGGSNRELTVTDKVTPRIKHIKSRFRVNSRIIRNSNNYSCRHLLPLDPARNKGRKVTKGLQVISKVQSLIQNPMITASLIISHLQQPLTIITRASQVGTGNRMQFMEPKAHQVLIGHLTTLQQLKAHQRGQTSGVWHLDQLIRMERRMGFTWNKKRYPWAGWSDKQKGKRR